MSAFYGEMTSTAVELLSEFGQPVTIKRQSGAVDPVTGDNDQAEQVFETVGVCARYSEQQINGSSILSGDQRMTLIPTVAPMIDDIITVAGIDYRVVDIAQSAPAGMVLVYFAQVRL